MNATLKSQEIQIESTQRKFNISFKNIAPTKNQLIALAIMIAFTIALFDFTVGLTSMCIILSYGLLTKASELVAISNINFEEMKDMINELESDWN